MTNPFKNVIEINLPKFNLGEQLIEYEAVELIDLMRAIVVSTWSNETFLILYFYQFYIGNGCKAVDRSEQSIIGEIFKDEWDSSKYSRIVKAAKMPIILGIEPNLVPPAVFRPFTKKNKEHWLEAWKLACKKTNREFPTAKEVKEAFDQLKEESTAETPDESADNVDSKTPNEGKKQPTPSTDDVEEADSENEDADIDSEVDSDESNPPPSKPKLKSSTTPDVALEKIKKWDDPKLIKRVILVLNGKSKLSKACIDIVQNFTKDERHQLVNDLRDLLK